ncbi:MAG: Uma2 family endonuclease [Vulcanimicrobiota bacterium]
MTVSLEDDRYWTYEDYLQLPDDRNRYEIIHGRLYVSPPPRTFHQTVSRRIQFLLYRLEQEKKGFIFNAPVGLMIPGGTPVEPDLVYLRTEQRQFIEERYINGPPHLVVEILSPSTASRDRTLKLNLYAQARVPHYWIVDPDACTLEVYHLKGDHYLVHAALDKDGSYTATEEAEGLEIHLPEIFAEY